jgi:hypothetical protein
MKIDERTEGFYKKIVFTKMSRRQFEYILEDNTKLTGFTRSRPDLDEWAEDHFVYYNNLGKVGEYQNGGGWMYPVNLVKSEIEPYGFEVSESWRRV